MNPYEPTKASVESPSFLNVKLRPATCTHCGHQFDGVAGKSFLGFQKFTCEKCSKDFGNALFPGYRITYWILLSLAVVAMVAIPGSQPNLFVILMGIAVGIDCYRLWKTKR